MILTQKDIDEFETAYKTLVENQLQFVMQKASLYSFNAGKNAQVESAR